MVVKCWPGVGRHACRFMSTDTRPSLGQHIGRVSVDISAECRSPYQPIVSTDTRLIDALSTHDPYILISIFFLSGFKTFPVHTKRIQMEFACPHTSGIIRIDSSYRETRPTPCADFTMSNREYLGLPSTRYFFRSTYKH